MSATDELRRMLDERGVKYRDYFHANKTWWSDRENVGWCAEDRTNANGLYVMIEAVLTPAQAIAATLGAGMCRDLGGTGANGEQVFNCSECGCVLSLYDSDGTNTLCTRFIYDYPRYCPECGRKVVDE